MLKSFHLAHLGIDSMLRRARETVYWPGMNNNIKQIAHNCYACQTTKPNQSNLPLIQHEIPKTAWEKVGADL